VLIEGQRRIIVTANQHPLTGLEAALISMELKRP
jgi:hypothetical protein